MDDVIEVCFPSNIQFSCRHDKMLQPHYTTGMLNARFFYFERDHNIRSNKLIKQDQHYDNLLHDDNH